MIVIKKGVDWHHHLRNDERTKIILPHLVRNVCATNVMPNVKLRSTGKYVVDSKSAETYHRFLQKKLKEVCGEDARLEFLMTLYLTDAINLQDMVAGYASGVFKAIKAYPTGATTGSDAGISNWRRMGKFLEWAERFGIPTLFHPEMPHHVCSDPLRSEAQFVSGDLVWIRKTFPELKMVIEHISDMEALKFVLDNPKNTWGTITPQHLYYCFDDIFDGGLQPALYCKPLLKQSEHQGFLGRNFVNAVMSGVLALGTDSAAHMDYDKFCSSGCAGVFSVPIMWESYVMAIKKFNPDMTEEYLESVLQKFTHNLAPVYGVDIENLPNHQVEIKAQENKVPNSHQGITSLFSGETLEWKALRVT